MKNEISTCSTLTCSRPDESFDNNAVATFHTNTLIFFASCNEDKSITRRGVSDSIDFFSHIQYTFEPLTPPSNCIRKFELKQLHTDIRNKNDYTCQIHIVLAHRYNDRAKGFLAVDLQSNYCATDIIKKNKKRKDVFSDKRPVYVLIECNIKLGMYAK
ncbi:hypothetical protein Bhyg_10438 [Pseudolycoriella hygida]|uniref:Uncharacterized protein n=1 Tax=Pseudolycoriella hygida TaxID=35572 RepID=A0A9Q0MW68_9DIPT|nr:hypothetical protein Bhyg_10438 [Pseudolycoriella hygida]